MEREGERNRVRLNSPRTERKEKEKEEEKKMTDVTTTKKKRYCYSPQLCFQSSTTETVSQF